MPMRPKPPVMVFITPQASCRQIIHKGAELANRLHSRLMVVTAQPKKADAQCRAADMRCLELLAKATQTEIQILYTDDPLRSLVRFAKKHRPIHIFTGQQSNGSSFVSKLAVLCNAPVTTVSAGALYTLPPISALLSDTGSHTVA